MIQLLDCTLRDGAHVNGGQFGNENIKKIASGLTDANLDYIELGFLKNVQYNPDISFYPIIENAYDVLPENIVGNDTTLKYALMARADAYDVKKLTDCNGMIQLIRIAFYYDYLEQAVEFAKEVKAKGYEFTFNLINTPGSSYEELEKVIEYANLVKPKILTIVDTFGVLQYAELDRILKLYDENLDHEIRIGLHVHENLALAYSLAQHFIYSVNAERSIVIDGSLMGMGRIPGNLCIELIADYMNNTFDKNYNISEIMRLISSIIDPIKRRIPWGYSPAYFLSAKYRVHRSYSEYLLKLGIPLDKMECVLKLIDAEHSLKFDKAYMDILLSKLY